MIYGIDTLGLAKYPEIIKFWPDGYACGVFATEFTDALKSVDKLLQTGKCPSLRVQLIWSNTHTYGDKDIPEIRKQSHRYELLAQKYKKVKIYISPFCEHNLSNPDKYLKIVEKYAPSCIPVNSIWKGALSKKYINEVHGSKAKAVKGKYIFSYDGNSANNADVETHKKRFKDTEIFFLWTSSFNGKGNDSEKTPIDQRNIWPTQKHIKAMKWLTTNKGKTNLPDKWICKPMADEHKGDPKSGKLCMISPIKTDFILLKGVSNSVSYKLKCFGTFEGGGYRYYSTEWGYFLADRFDVLCDVFIGSKKYGSINGGFRQNEYR